MPARKVARPVPRAQVVDHHIDSLAAADRMAGQFTDETQRNRSRPRSVVVQDLAIGANRVLTGLGIKAVGCTLTPTVIPALGVFQWSFVMDGDKTAVITIAGAAQPNATLEFFV